MLTHLPNQHNHVPRFSVSKATKEDCATTPLPPKKESFDPVWELSQSLLKDWGTSTFFFLHLSPHPYPSLSPMLSYNQDAKRKHRDKKKCIRTRIQPDRQASQDPGGRKRRLSLAISDFIRGSSNKKSPSRQVSSTVSSSC